MRKKIDFLAILLVILLALSLGLGAVSVYCDHAYRETLSSNNALGELLDDLAAAADLGGAPAVEDFDVSSYGLWEGKSDENFNAVLVEISYEADTVSVMACELAVFAYNYCVACADELCCR